MITDAFAQVGGPVAGASSRGYHGGLFSSGVVTAEPPQAPQVCLAGLMQTRAEAF